MIEIQDQTAHDRIRSMWARCAEAEARRKSEREAEEARRRQFAILVTELRDTLSPLIGLPVRPEGGQREPVKLHQDIDTRFSSGPATISLAAGNDVIITFQVFPADASNSGPRIICDDVEVTLQIALEVATASVEIILDIDGLFTEPPPF